MARARPSLGFFGDPPPDKQTQQTSLTSGLPPLPSSPPTLEERNKQAEKELATRYDALNQLFTQVEQALKALKPPHPVWYAYDRVPVEQGLERWQVLGLLRYQDKWRLCHAYDSDIDFMDDIKPIVECPIDVRIRAAKEVRHLQEKIVKSKEEYIPKVDEAIKELIDLCNAASMKGGR